jgi:phenylpropionate dioxygenase-like ring-hydroxylating dioxygenase large terminal subunit
MLSASENAELTASGRGSIVGEYLRRFWTPILLSSELPEPDGDPRDVRILGEDLVAFRDTEGEVGLLQALCPHRQAPLSYGRNEEHGLRCIYHGWKFSRSGVCVDMPNEPHMSDFKDRVRARAYPVREAAGIVWAYLGPPELQPALPELEWARVPDSHRYVVKYLQDCNWVQALEGDMDSSHVGFLHRELATIEAWDKEATSDETRERREYWTQDLAPKWALLATQYGMMLGAQRSIGGGRYYWRVNQWLLPYYTMVAQDLAQKRGTCDMYVPIDDEHTQFWQVRWRPHEPLTQDEIWRVLDGPSPSIATLDTSTGRLRATKANRFLQDRSLQRTSSFTGIRGVREQDTAVVEGMGTVVDRTQEHLGTSDTAIIAMRRELLGRARELKEGIEPYAATHGDVYRVRAWSALLTADTDSFADDPEVKRLTESLVRV